MVHRVFNVAAPVLVAVACAAACGEKSEGNDPDPTPTNSTTGPGTATGPAMTMPGTGPAMTTAPTTQPTTGPSMTATMMPTATGPMSSCMNTMDDGVAPSEVSGATWIFSYSDSANATCMTPTKHCLNNDMPNSVCFDGIAAPAGDDYECWGAGMGIQMALADAMGTIQLPWNATEIGVAGVKFTIAGAAGGPKIRAQLSQVGLPDDAAFVHGGGTADIGTDGEKVLMFDEFTLPSWTTMANPDLVGATLDASQIKALQIQVVTVQTGEKPYNFCLNGLTWLDANEMPVMVTAPEPVGAGGAGGMSGMGGGDTGAGGGGGAGPAPTGMGGADTGMGGADTGMGGADTGMGGADTGMGGGGGAPPAEIDFATQIYPIFEANCTPCHDDANAMGKPIHASAMVETAEMQAMMSADDIIDRITRAADEDGRMPPGDAPRVGAADVELITEWANSLP